MSMLARYKKSPGQIIELVKLIEESPEPKRSQLLQMIRSEDPDFTARVEARVLTFADIQALHPDVLAEIIAVTPAKHLALALHGTANVEFVKTVERCLGNKFSEYKEEVSSFQAEAPHETKIEAGQRKMISEARKLEKSGAIKLPMRDGGDAASTHAAASSATSSPGSGENSAASSSAGVPPPSASHAAQAVILANGLAPSIESFGFAAPPPGMSGERFETYIKKLIT